MRRIGYQSLHHTECLPAPPFARLKLIIIQFWKVNEILRATGKYPTKMLQRDFCYVPFPESIMYTDIVCFLASRKHSGGVFYLSLLCYYVSVYSCVHFWRWKEMHQAKRSFIVSTKIVTHAEENKFEKFRIVRSISVNKTCCMMLHDDTATVNISKMASIKQSANSTGDIQKETLCTFAQ